MYNLVKQPFIIILLFLLLASPGLLTAQETAEEIAQLRKTVFLLQQEVLQLKEQLDKQTREIQSQREQLTLQVKRLNEENRKIKQQLLEMDSLVFQMEDQLASSSVVNLQREIKNLRDFNLALLLARIDRNEVSEKLLLDILNQPDTSLPKDLLILILAQQKERQEQYEESLRYYSTLLSEFTDSEYFTQAIYEMSQVFAAIGESEQQTTLLAQLSTLSETDPYSKRASEALENLNTDSLLVDDTTTSDQTADAAELVIEAPSTQAGAQRDATGDGEMISDATADTIQAASTPTDATADTGISAPGDAAAGVQVPVAKDVSGDASTDAQVHVPGVISGDASADVQSPVPEEQSGDASADVQVPDPRNQAEDVSAEPGSPVPDGNNTNMKASHDATADESPGASLFDESFDEDATSDTN